ncbi:hypothetical protein Hanom_Chr02g00095591 [Helianthus anomalus]
MVLYGVTYCYTVFIYSVIIHFSHFRPFFTLSLPYQLIQVPIYRLTVAEVLDISPRIAYNRDDFPAPIDPHTAIFCPHFTSRFISLSVGIGDSGSHAKFPCFIVTLSSNFSLSWSVFNKSFFISSSSTKKELIRSNETLTWINAEIASGKNLTGSDILLKVAKTVKTVAASKGTLPKNTHPISMAEETSVGDNQYKIVP